MRHFLYFSRIAQSWKIDAREGGKMPNFGAKSHLVALSPDIERGNQPFSLYIENSVDFPPTKSTRLKTILHIATPKTSVEFSPPGFPHLFTAVATLSTSSLTRDSGIDLSRSRPSSSSSPEEEEEEEEDDRRGSTDLHLLRWSVRSARLLSPSSRRLEKKYMVFF